MYPSKFDYRAFSPMTPDQALGILAERGET